MSTRSSVSSVTSAGLILADRTEGGWLPEGPAVGAAGVAVACEPAGLGNPDGTAASTVPRGRWYIAGRQLGSNMDLHLCWQPRTQREGLSRERIAARCHSPNGRGCVRTTGQVVHRIELPLSSGLTDIGAWDEGREEHGPAEQRGR